MIKKFRTQTLMQYSTRYQKTKISEITDIEIDYNDIHIKSEKNIYTAPRYRFSENCKATTSIQEKKAKIEDIDKIYYRKTKNIMGIYITGIIIFALLFVFFSSKEIIMNYKNFFPVLLKHIAVDSFFSMLWLIIGLPYSFLIGMPVEELFISFKDGDKICFPYYKYRSGENIGEFIKKVKENNTEIRIINKKKKTNVKIIFIIVLLICMQLYFSYVGYIQSQYKKAEEKLEKEIKVGNYYTEEELIKLKFIKTDKFLGYNIYENVKTKEKIKIKEENVTRTQQEYNFLFIKYFSKTDKEKLIGEKYSCLGKENLNNEFHSETNESEYYVINGELYKFNKNNNGTKLYYRINFYDKEKIENESWNFLNRHKLYDFIYSNNDFINNENNNYKSFEKKGVFNSEYGKCYIVKADEYLKNSHRFE